MIKDSEYLEGNQEIIAKLRQIPVLRSLDEQEMKDLLAFSDLREYKAGETILKEGRVDSTVYYLISGQVQIVKMGKELLVL
jgi:CRP/FNR family cyclic AMP-dependent transcriptional regulator